MPGESTKSGGGIRMPDGSTEFFRRTDMPEECEGFGKRGNVFGACYGLGQGMDGTPSFL